MIHQRALNVVAVVVVDVAVVAQVIAQITTPHKRILLKITIQHRMIYLKKMQMALPTTVVAAVVVRAEPVVKLVQRKRLLMKMA
jgi:hypothetical protein